MSKTKFSQPKPDEVKQPPWPKLREVLGPGLITGASDDDPSGIVTYSQAGAQFGYALGWTLLFSYPLMCAIQQISAQLGRVTGRGIAGNLRLFMPRWSLYSIVFLLLVANVINLGADLGAMAAAVKLLIPVPMPLGIIGFGLITILLETFVRHARYVSALKWLTLSLFAYVGTVLIAGAPCGFDQTCRAAG
jgi:NRAMP (natural resistance-associated macrophage protein)-like metal ion transporter